MYSSTFDPASLSISNPPPPSSSPRFNLDIVRLVLLQVERDPRTEFGPLQPAPTFPVYTTLSTACLVSRAWRDVARPLLFRNLPDLEHESARLLVRTIRNDVSILPLVHTVCPYTTDLFWLLLDSLKPTAARFPNVRSFALRHSPLSQNHNHPTRTLFPNAQEVLIEPLVSAEPWPTGPLPLGVEKLSIRINSSARFFDRLLPERLVGLPVQELSIRHAAPDQVRSSTSSSHSSTSPSAPIERLLENYAPTLTTLTLRLHPSFLPEAILELTPKLVSLALRNDAPLGRILLSGHPTLEKLNLLASPTTPGAADDQDQSTGTRAMLGRVFDATAFPSLRCVYFEGVVLDDLARAGKAEEK